MSRPICCGRNATPYKKVWNSNPPSWETGFRCKKCGRIRIPYLEWDAAKYQQLLDEVEAMRLEGIKFDNALSLSRDGSLAYEESLA